MYKFLLTLLLTLPLPLCGQDLIVSSYNIRNGMGMGGERDLDRTASVITGMGARFVALQEVDSVTMRSGKLDVLSMLAAKCAMQSTYARAIAYDGGAYGIGLLSRDKPLSTRRVALDGREEARVLLVAEFEDCIVFCTHFSLTTDDQTSSIRRVVELAKEYRKPIIFMGDLNLEPSSPQFDLLREHFILLSSATQPTYPADKPTQTIDYIWSSLPSKYNVKYSEVVDAPTESDHRPIKVCVSVNR
ncbi:MAG: endonuclease/exonuclease/phosphatase family protein [Mucinivorans sp.]